MTPGQLFVFKLLTTALVVSVYLSLVYLVIVGSVHLRCHVLVACLVRISGFALVAFEGYSLAKAIEEWNA